MNKIAYEWHIYSLLNKRPNYDVITAENALRAVEAMPGNFDIYSVTRGRQLEEKELNFG